MRRMLTNCAASLIALALLVPGAAQAQDRGDRQDRDGRNARDEAGDRKDRRDARKERREKRREARKERRENRKERREEAKERREDVREARKERREDRRGPRRDRDEKVDERREERRDRRRDRDERVDERREDRRDRRRDRDERVDRREDRREVRDERRNARRERIRERRRRYLQRALVSGYSPDGGPPGTRVVIRGRNFDSGTKVRIGGRDVQARVGPGRIVFQVPRGTGDGPIVIEPPGQRRILVGRFDTQRRFDRSAWRQRRRDSEARARKRWLERKRDLAKTREERRRAWEEREAELARTRAERRRRRAAEIRARWEARVLAHPEVQAEMVLHAQRAARLQRMLRLAEIDGRDKLAIRIEVLMDREDERHNGRIEFLKGNLEI